jgi:hypothetical protein
MSGVLLTPEADHLVLPDGSIWVPDWNGREPIPMDRVVPRVCLAPATFAFSSGTEAIELAAAAGLTLDPWQQLALMLALGETAAGRWAAFQVALIVARQNGKGSILEALELFWLFNTAEPLVGHSAHEYKTAMEAFRRILFLIENNDWLRKKVKKVINTNGEEGIELLTGQRLRFMARSKGAGRGFTFHKLVWDEGYALTREQQNAQLPTMSAVDNPQIIITSSPPLSSDTGPVLFQLRRAAQTLADRTVFLDYGAAGSLDKLDQVDLDDQSIWRTSNPSEAHAGSGHGVSIEFMQGERAGMDDEGFGRERLCIWPPDLTQGFGVITKEQWAAMTDPNSGSDEWQDKDFPDPSLPMPEFVKAAQHPPTHLVGTPVLAVHVSPRGRGTVMAAIGLASYRHDGKRHLELLASGLGTSWVIEHLKRALSRSTFGAIVLDPGSPAGSLLADMVTMCSELGLNADDMIIKMTSGDVARAFGMIYDAANGTGDDPSVVHLGQSELTLAVGGAVDRKLGDGTAWDALKSTTDSTPLISLTHALWGLAQERTQIEEAEPMVMWA